MSKELGEERREFEYGAGCEVCRYTGYLGRVPVFELLMVTDAIRELIIKRAPASEIRLQTINEGMTTMIRDAALKIKDNLTTPRKVIRKVSTRV
ncbi:MAG: hypothetical protein QGI09_09360 [Dehalococcoidia bacterium]|nr:hypothetical protein [Dehalococcoidia bacterium]